MNNLLLFFITDIKQNNRFYVAMGLYYIQINRSQRKLNPLTFESD